MLHYLIISSKESEILFSHSFNAQNEEWNSSTLQSAVARCKDDSLKQKVATYKCFTC